MNIITNRIGNYSITGLISETKASIVYKSHSLSREQDVIIKVLNTTDATPSDIALFKQVFSDIIAHPDKGTVNCHEMFETKEGMALVFEAFDGTPLGSFIAGTPMETETFLELSISLTETLDRLHQNDVPHLALKPSSIVFNRDTGVIKLTEFGAIGQFTGEFDFFHDPEVIEGALPYISPEQTGRMNWPIDYRSDIYSLGTVFYQMLTGRPPFQAQDPMELIHAHIARTPATPEALNPSIPSMISEIVMKMLLKTPEERYQSSFGISSDLSAVREEFLEKGQVTSFELSRNDISKQFNIPQKLFGRESEIAELMDCYDKVCQGEKILAMIGGPPGIGKTALTRELDIPIVEQNGFFISGKYEQLRKDVPYSAIIQAISSLIREILQENRKSIEQWKDIIVSALSPNGKVITDVIPELTLIIGDQPEVSQLESEQAKNRFNYMFEVFIKAVSCVDKPLVMFLDDLQWADLASIEFMERITFNSGIRNILIIGSYRETDVSPSHPLMQALSRIKDSPTRITTFLLDPITEFDVRDLIANFLKSSHERAATLASLVYNKTGGNPFFINQFLKRMYEKGAITPDKGLGWSWDDDKLSSMQVTDNLVDLLVEKIGTMSIQAREILKTCACIGNRFELEMIALMMKQSIDSILYAINETIKAGLIGKTSVMYVFHHDRIQEAAYSLIPEEDRAFYHYKVGHLELKRCTEADIRKKLFYIVDQLRAGISHLQPDEIEGFIRLCHQAGEKAKTSVAYDQATAYLETGISLLREDAWKTTYSLAYNLHRQLIETLYLAGHFERAESLYSLTLENTTSKVDIGNIASLMVNLFISQGDYEKAIETGYQGCKLVYKPLPRASNNLSILWGLLGVMAILRNKKIEDILDFPEITDEMALSYIRLITNTGTGVYYSDPNRFARLVFVGMRFSLKRGVWEQSDFGLIAIGCIVGSSLGFFKYGYRFGKTALQLCERRPGNINLCRMNFLFAMMIHPWTSHAKGSLDYFRKAYTYGVACGDLLFSCHSINHIGIYSLILGRPLTEATDEYHSYQDFMAMNKDPFARKNYQENNRFIMCLKGETPVPGDLNDDTFNEKERINEYIQEKNSLGRYYFESNLIRLRYLFGRYEEAIAIGASLATQIKKNVGLGSLYNGEILLYQTLAMTAVYNRAKHLDKIRYTLTIKKNLFKMGIWANYAPDNFAHKLALMQAEYFKIKGKFYKSAQKYREATQLASESGYLNCEALAYTLTGRFYLQGQYDEIAGHCFTDACLCYQKLQAPGLVDYLTGKYSKLIHHNILKGSASVDESGSLDLSTVIKASQAISGQIQLGGLLEAMLRNTMENAGAERGTLVLVNDNRMVVEAESAMDRQSIAVMQSVPLDEHEGICRGIIHYTARTQTPLILEHASKKGDFIRDPYIIKHQVKSVLCLPIVNQRRLTALIYFENNVAPNAFKQDNIELLEILSSQAAIAIDNARLYENLEEKVRLRTDELNQILKTVEEANQRTMAGIRYSSLIQQCLLPDPDDVRKSMPESCFIWQPRDIISGDIYFVEPMGNDFILAVIDCTGHGVPGAFMTILAVTGLRRIIHEEKEYNPANILKRLNAFVKHSLGNTRQSDDGMDAGICRFRSESGILEFSGARIALYENNGNTINTIKGDKQSLGYISSNPDFDFTLHEIPACGQSFYITTDGYIDQLSGPVSRKKRFGTKRFKDVLLSCHTQPFSSQKTLLENALKRHKGSNDSTDDVTVVGFRVFP